MHPRRLYAHRGASAERPENTMPAFERAIEIGVDALEMDVHLTRDDQLIVVHDDTAARTCGVPRPWRELDLVDAQGLDAGWGFVAPDGTRPFAGKGVAVPTFASVLEAFPRIRINVDLKGARAVELMLALLRAQRAEDRVTLASFQLQTLAQIRRRGFGGETALSQPEVASLIAVPAMLWATAAADWLGGSDSDPRRPDPVGSRGVHREVPQRRAARRLLDDRRPGRSGAAARARSGRHHDQ